MNAAQASERLMTEAFHACGWRAVVSGVKRSDSSSFFDAFRAAAAEAEEAGRSDQARVLTLLARASSMLLQPESVNEPFGPLAVLGGRRTTIVEDFSDDEVDFFTQVVDEVDDAWLQARLADLVWVLRREHEAARTAIDAYRYIPIALEDFAWRLCWERAIRLAQMLRDGERLGAIEDHLLDTLDQAELGLALSLSELLLETGLAKGKANHVAQKLRDGAVAMDQAGKHSLAIECFEAAAAWFKQAHDETETAAATIRVGDLWAQQARVHLSSEQPSHLNARFAAEKALKAYRRVPGRYREDLGVDIKIGQVRTLLEQASSGSLGEMGVISSLAIDISEKAAEARRRVQGLGVAEALEAFATLLRPMSISALEAGAKETLDAHPLVGLLTATHLSEDGRVVARSSSADGQTSGGWMADGATRRQVLQDYGFEVDFAVQGVIWPALQVLNLEHRITERELLAVALSSPVVPPERERLFAKGLAVGFDRDFATALHLLVPQVEHMVRFHLKQHGVVTTTVDDDGVEMEVGLSALLKKREVLDIFGEDLAFELQALFTDPIGFNFRNDVAHGLLKYDAAMSLNSAYAWWWCFRLVYLTYRQAAARTEGARDVQDAGTDADEIAPDDDPAPEGEAK